MIKSLEFKNTHPISMGQTGWSESELPLNLHVAYNFVEKLWKKNYWIPYFERF